jgi:maltose O-acetyltransferase
VPFKWCIPLRARCYRPFFASVGRNLAIHDAVTIKYPSDMSLGDRVTINTMCFIAGKGGLTIGNDVMIGSGSKIVSANHRTDRFDIPMQDQGLDVRPVVIEDDVWLGFDVKVMPGAVIRRGSVIGGRGRGSTATRPTRR